MMVGLQTSWGMFGSENREDQKHLWLMNVSEGMCRSSGEPYFVAKWRWVWKLLWRLLCSGGSFWKCAEYFTHCWLYEGALSVWCAAVHVLDGCKKISQWWDTCWLFIYTWDMTPKCVLCTSCLKCLFQSDRGFKFLSSHKCNIKYFFITLQSYSLKGLC